MGAARPGRPTRHNPRRSPETAGSGYTQQRNDSRETRARYRQMIERQLSRFYEPRLSRLNTERVAVTVCAATAGEPRAVRPGGRGRSPKGPGTRRFGTAPGLTCNAPAAVRWRLPVGRPPYPISRLAGVSGSRRPAVRYQLERSWTLPLCPRCRTSTSMMDECSIRPSNSLDRAPGCEQNGQSDAPRHTIASGQKHKPAGDGRGCCFAQTRRARARVVQVDPREKPGALVWNRQLRTGSSPRSREAAEAKPSGAARSVMTTRCSLRD